MYECESESVVVEGSTTTKLVFWLAIILFQHIFPYTCNFYSLLTDNYVMGI